MVDEMTAAGKVRKKPDAVLITRICAALAAAAVFVFYASKNVGKYPFWSFILPFASLALFTLCVWFAVPKLIKLLKGYDEFAVTETKDKSSPTKRFITICVFALLLHFVLLIVGAWLYGAIIGAEDDLLLYWRDAWMKRNTDAGHYLTLARDWYVNTGDNRLLLVFFPLFPMLIRLLDLIVHDGFVSALIINAVSVSLMSGTVYLTLRQWLGGRRATAGAFIAVLTPGAIFLNSPMTEPLFMLFCAAGFLFIQKKRYIAAGVFAGLAGMTRSLGVLMCVPIFISGLSDLIRLAKEKKKVSPIVWKLAGALLIGVSGTLFYLGLNYSLYKDPLKFLEFQSSNWYQKACPFFDTPRYALNNLINAFKEKESAYLAFSLWIPNFIAIFGSLALMCAVNKEMPLTFTAFFLFYFAAAIGCTWLLSGMRYICAAVPVIAGLASICKKRSATVIIFTTACVLYTAYTLMYMLRWAVY